MASGLEFGTLVSPVLSRGYNLTHQLKCTWVIKDPQRGRGQFVVMFSGSKRTHLDWMFSVAP
jgi:hypothetical protein